MYCSPGYAPKKKYFQRHAGPPGGTQGLPKANENHKTSSLTQVVFKHCLPKASVRTARDDVRNSKHGQCLGHMWAMCGTCVGHIWARFSPYYVMFGTSLGHTWDIFGAWLGDVWAMFGSDLGNVWDIFGSSLSWGHVWDILGHLWDMFETSLEHVWDMWGTIAIKQHFRAITSKGYIWRTWPGQYLKQRNHKGSD
jgi:hypothetical protein